MYKYAELLEGAKLFPSEIEKAAERLNITPGELMDKAAESYELFIADVMFKAADIVEDKPMDKEAMEKCSAMEKEAFLTAGAVLAAMTLPFAAMSAWDLGKNTLGGANDIIHGRFGSALRRAPAMAFDTLGVIPGIGQAGKALKLGRTALKAKTLGKGLRAVGGQIKMSGYWRKLQKAERAAEKLNKGKALWTKPSTWFMGQAERAAHAKGQLNAAKQAWKAGVANAAKAQKEAFGKAGKIIWTRPEMGMVEALKPGSKAYTQAELRKMEGALPEFSHFYSKGAHNLYSRGMGLWGWDLARLAPPLVAGAGALTGINALKTAGNTGEHILSYYGPEEQNNEEIAKRRQLMRAMRSAGYVGGYTYS